MKTYLQLLQDVLLSGVERPDRTGVGTRSVFGRQLRFPLADSFPLLTTKKVNFRGVVCELLWFLSGSTNVDYLHRHGVHIWDAWADERGDLGPIYGAQWRAWPDEKGQPIDQLRNLLKDIQNRPSSRRLMLAAWNVAQIKSMRLPPCHCLAQFYVAEGRISCHLYQRSGDIFLGVPFNIASYSLLTLMIAQVCNLQPGELIHSFGDLHLYQNHVEQAETQLKRTPTAPPKVQLNPEVRNIFSFQENDVELIDYHPHPAIKAEIAV